MDKWIYRLSSVKANVLHIHEHAFSSRLNLWTGNEIYYLYTCSQQYRLQHTVLYHFLLISIKCWCTIITRTNNWFIFFYSMKYLKWKFARIECSLWGALSVMVVLLGNGIVDLVFTWRISKTFHCFHVICHFYNNCFYFKIYIYIYA